MGTGTTDVIGGPRDFLPPRSNEFPKLWGTLLQKGITASMATIHHSSNIHPLNQCLSLLQFVSFYCHSWRGITLQDKVGQPLKDRGLFSLGTLVPSPMNMAYC